MSKEGVTRMGSDEDQHRQHLSAVIAQAVTAHAGEGGLRAAVEVLVDEADSSGRHVNGYGYVLARELRAILAAHAEVGPVGTTVSAEQAWDEGMEVTLSWVEAIGHPASLGAADAPRNPYRGDR